MNSHRYLLIGLALGLSLLPHLPATTVDAPDLDSLINQSDYVVRAVVRSATPEWRESAGKRYISTRFELEVSEVINGTPPVPLVLDLLGGRIGDMEFAIMGMPVFQVGDESILFVYGTEKKLYPLVAMMHGVYPILRETKTGQDYMLRANGVPLYSTADVAQPMDHPSAVLKQKNSSVRPLTPKAFIQQIRQRAGRGQPQLP